MCLGNLGRLGMVVVYTNFQLEAGVAVLICSQNCSLDIAGGSILAQRGVTHLHWACFSHKTLNSSLI